MASLKNWEAQARTNSILAGSIQALEARVDDCYLLIDWREEVENKFQAFEGDITIIKEKQESQERGRQREREAGTPGRRMSILDVVTGARRRSVTGGLTGQDAAAAATADVAAQEALVQVKAGPKLRLSCSMSLPSWCYGAHLANLLLVVALLLYAGYHGNAVSQMHLGVFAASLLVGVVGASRVGSVEAGTGAPNIMLASSAWTLALAASLLHEGVHDMGRHYAFCRLPVPGISQGDCDLRQIHAVYK